MRFKNRHLALALAATAMTVSSVAAPTAAMAASKGSKGGKKEGGKHAPLFGECNTLQWILVAPICIVAEYVNREDTPPAPPKPKPKPRAMGDGDEDWGI
jgi:hypothetical protein